MLPTNPRMGPRGLPSNPKPRSRSTGRSRDDPRSRPPEEDSYQSPPRSSSRPGIQAERSRTPPLPASRRPLRQTDTRPQTRPSHRSDDSASSTTSSLLDRMKFGSGYASSRTSLEEDHKPLESTLRPDGATKSLRQRRLPGEYQASPIGLEETSETGDGHAIWSRVATAASTLTVSVSKAWAANVTTSAGEETPPGQDSRLTRALKAYHLEKARDPTDLPPWLFDERERRRPVSVEQLPSRDADDNRYQQEQPVHDMPKSRGLRDIYDAYTPEAPVSRPSHRVFSEDPPPSKATDRLKALRDAKRNVLAPPPRRPLVEATGSDSQYDFNPKGVAPRARVGLPSGPRRL
ncbi:hypothetical protein FPV67DRAFT_1463723 [Lyophyllum atratum]|nr:hypothetical protein FPV67DRAFT_1463723 [Lyophyllum atratum]